MGHVWSWLLQQHGRSKGAWDGESAHNPITLLVICIPPIMASPQRLPGFIGSDPSQWDCLAAIPQVGSFGECWKLSFVRAETFASTPPARWSSSAIHSALVRQLPHPRPPQRKQKIGEGWRPPLQIGVRLVPQDVSGPLEPILQFSRPRSRHLIEAPNIILSSLFLL